ncbi:hypothetical protein, partial [Kosakonia oryziphila]|uniref:hypothetical protein n=1 Tax=Kosakonia oryziphila TaxID=1005667 RepID=UPI001ABF2EC9
CDGPDGWKEYVSVMLLPVQKKTAGAIPEKRGGCRENRGKCCCGWFPDDGPECFICCRRR